MSERYIPDWTTPARRSLRSSYIKPRKPLKRTRLKRGIIYLQHTIRDGRVLTTVASPLLSHNNSSDRDIDPALLRRLRARVSSTRSRLGYTHR